MSVDRREKRTKDRVYGGPYLLEIGGKRRRQQRTMRKKYPLEQEGEKKIVVASKPSAKSVLKRSKGFNCVQMLPTIKMKSELTI